MRPYLVDLLNQWFDTRIFIYVVPNYIIMLSLGAIAGTLWAARRARVLGLDPDAVHGLALWGFPAAFLGSRLRHWLHASQTDGGSIVALFDPLRGAGAAYDGLMAGTATALIYLWWRRLDQCAYLDCVVPAVGLGTCLTRLGCFLDGCDFGSVTTSPLAVCFPAGSLAYRHQVELGLLSASSLHSLPVHPVQLYLAANGLLLAALTASWRRLSRTAPGEVFCAYWLLYGGARFGLEFLRGDVSRGVFGFLTTSQAISLLVVLSAGGALWQRWQHRSQ